MEYDVECPVDHISRDEVVHTCREIKTGKTPGHLYVSLEIICCFELCQSNCPILVLNKVYYY